ncbi:MAG TPA: hypothetical protein VH540_11965 [Ktedonobacterales bacterium]|jgi:hypothetical protein
MIAHLLSSSAFLSGIVLALLLAWLIGSAVMTLRVGKTAVGPYEEEQQEAIRRSRRLEQAPRVSASVEAPSPAGAEAQASARSVRIAPPKNVDTEPTGPVFVSKDVL